ncbi:gp36.3 [Bacillus phage SPO1]|uniref:Gp36.3 n=1 Tax=Bacillus phage SP01 TaxID=2884427 RepID=B6V2H5_BPSP1|nr:gp36.3 [Bacillus phage SPO1]ACI90908.1 gp36.3 [Bacillus phage SPO1]
MNHNIQDLQMHANEVCRQIGAKAVQDYLKKVDPDMVLAYSDERGYFIFDPNEEPPTGSGNGETASQVELYIDLTKPLEGADFRRYESPNPSTITLP